MKLFTKMVAAAALLAATQANAVVIDFGAAPWTPNAHNQSSYTVGSVTATAGPQGALLFANDPHDGLGVQCSVAACTGPDEIDEINGKEYLTLSFAKTTQLYSVKVTDFFPKHHLNDNNDGSDVTGEKGYIGLWLGSTNIGTYTIYGANSTVYQNNPWVDEGDQVINFMGQSVTSITFWAAGLRDEFSVRSITAEVPEPGLLGLFGLGMLCLGLSRRRQANAA